MRTGLEDKTDRELNAMHDMAHLAKWAFYGIPARTHDDLRWREAAEGLIALVRLERSRRGIAEGWAPAVITIDAIDNVSDNLRQIGDIVAGMDMGADYEPTPRPDPAKYEIGEYELFNYCDVMKKLGCVAFNDYDATPSDSTEARGIVAKVEGET